MYYFDNAATTAQKPDCVAKAVYQVLSSGTVGNPSRGAHGYALKAYGLVLQAKDDVKALFQCGPEYDVAFTHNSTAALNMVLKGLIRPGDGVLTTSWEHNAVLRPLYQLEKEGVSLAFIGSDQPSGALQYDTMEALLTPQTKWFVCNHASNVTGNVLDLPRIKAFCRRHHLGLIVDVSQTVGAIDVDLSDGIVTAACFTGHKSLYGPGGTGGIVIRRDAVVTPYITGGDGVHSFEREQPGAIPGVFEAGTANVAGIAGLDAGIRYILDKGVAAAAAHQQELARIFVPAVQAISGIRLYGDFPAPASASTASMWARQNRLSSATSSGRRTTWRRVRPTIVRPSSTVPWGRPSRERCAFPFPNSRRKKMSRPLCRPCRTFQSCKLFSQFAGKT